MKRVIFTVVCSLVILCCASCRNTDDFPTENTETTIKEWNNEPFKADRNVKAEECIYLDEFVTWEHTYGEDGFITISKGGNNDFFWSLGVLLDEEDNIQRGENANYSLDVYCAKTGSTSSFQFTPKDIGASGEIGYIVNVQVLRENYYMFRWSEYEFDNELYGQISDKIIYSDLNGNNNSFEVSACFKEFGVEEYEQAILPFWPYEECNSLIDDIIWVQVKNQIKNNRLYVFSAKGDLLLNFEGSKNQIIYSPITSETGQLILPVWNTDSKQCQFLYANLDDYKWETVGEIECNANDIKQFYSLVGNDIYYQSVNPETNIGEGIVKWDIVTGERKWILKYDIPYFSKYSTRLCFADNRLVSVLLSRNDHADKKDYLILVSNERREDDNSVTIADFTGNCGQLSKAAANASMDNPNYKFSYLSVASEEEKNRIKIELSQGKGPELMFVKMEDYYNFIEKGLICDWYSLGEMNVLDDVISGAVKMGTIDNKLYGLPVGVNVRSLASEYDISSDDWNLETLGQLIREGKINIEMKAPYINSIEYYSPEHSVYTLVSYALGNSYLIDWENNVAHFDEERFVKLLEIINSSSEKSAQEKNDAKNLLSANIYEYFDLVDYVSREPNEYSIVGYPNGINGESYISPTNGALLVINSNVNNLEIVQAYLSSLLDKGIQMDIDNYCMGIVKYKPEDFAREGRSGNKIYMNYYDTNKYDETRIVASIDKAISFLDSCRPVTNDYDEIKKIIHEEISIMVSKNRDEKETAIIINGRINTLLQENE